MKRTAAATNARAAHMRRYLPNTAPYPNGGDRVVSALTRRKQTGPTESEVQSAVLEYLHTDPRVAAAWRQNNGGTYFADKRSGRATFVRFARDKDGQAVTLLDIGGYLTDGRYLAIECKRKLPRPETVARWSDMLDSALTRDAAIYLRQRAVIEHARRNGVVAGFVCSVDDTKALIDAYEDIKCLTPVR